MCMHMCAKFFKIKFFVRKKMELFVINRHGEEKNEITEEEEKARLDRVLKRIERKKQQRKRQRERQKLQKNTKSKCVNENEQEKIENLPKNDKINNETEEKMDTSNDTNKKPHKTSSEPLNLKDFTVLGAETSTKKVKAERVLPQWLANPTVISSNLQDLNVKVSKMKQLDKTIRTQLKSNGVEYFFPVQAEVIPWLLETRKHVDVMYPRDICVSAPTGSGKTLAFVLPVVQALKKYAVKKIRALVILPTQDLAEQVFKTFKIYTQGTSIDTGLISGKNLFANEQKQLVHFSEAFGYVSKVDILVCTAGRLVSHLKETKGFSLQSLEYLIIDEADRVLESVQDDWLYHLEKHISEDSVSIQSKKILNLASLQKQKFTQKLLFSATLTQDPEKLEKLSLFQPKLFTCVTESSEGVREEKGTFMGKFTTPKELTEKYIACSKDLKPLVLYKFIKREALTRTMVFTHSVESAHRLKILLQNLFKTKLKIEEISSSLKGRSRDGLIADFSKGEIDVLICTDSLARGIDLPGVRCVISYSAPKYLKTYIHRAGRTARAGETGLAVTLLHKEQLSLFKSMLAQAKKTDVDELEVDEEELASLGKKYKKALNGLKEVIEKEEKTGKINLLSKKKSIQIETKVRKSGVK